MGGSMREGGKERGKSLYLGLWFGYNDSELI